MLNTDTNNYFSKIPNILFYDKDKTSIFLKSDSHDYKIILVLDYLYMCVNRKNSIRFTVNDIVSSCGFKPNNRDGKINSQFISILELLHNCEIINFDTDLFNINSSDTIVCSFKLNLDKSFMCLFEREKSLLLNYTDDTEKVDNIKLLFYYGYIKCRMFKRNQNNDDMNMSGGRAEVAYPSFETISHDLLLTDKTIKKYNDILVKLNLIRIQNAGHWHYKDDPQSVRESPNFYTLFDGIEANAKSNLKEGIKYYRSLDINSNKEFTDSRKYIRNDSHVNGLYGSLIKKYYHGTISDDELIKKQEIEKSKSDFSEEYKIKALLEKHPNELLYQIYDDLHKEDLAEKYFGLESELGLIDENSNALVDRKYYVWVLTNYDEKKKQYIINCVEKHKRDNMSDDDIVEAISHAS